MSTILLIDRLDEIRTYNEEAGEIFRNAMAKCPSMTLSHLLVHPLMGCQFS
jgi:hypothetical protein